MHPRYSSGKYSRQCAGILPTAVQVHDAVQELLTLRPLLAVNKALLYHKLDEVDAAGPSDHAWIELGRMTDRIERCRGAGQWKRMAALLAKRDVLINTQRSSVIARREASKLIDTQSKLVGTEERRKD